VMDYYHWSDSCHRCSSRHCGRCHSAPWWCWNRCLHQMTRHNLQCQEVTQVIHLQLYFLQFCLMEEVRCKLILCLRILCWIG
jgi:hypothetical protein